MSGQGGWARGEGELEQRFEGSEGVSQVDIWGKEVHDSYPPPKSYATLNNHDMVTRCAVSWMGKSNPYIHTVPLGYDMDISWVLHPSP